MSPDLFILLAYLTALAALFALAGYIAERIAK